MGIDMRRYFTGDEEFEKIFQKYDEYTNEKLLDKIKKICNSEEVQEIIKYMLTGYEIRLNAFNMQIQLRELKERLGF